MTFKNPHSSPPISYSSLIRAVYSHRQLILQMIKREVIGRYKGSIFGLAWSFLNPVLMLAIYTFVFSIVFKARWGVNSEETKMQFALLVFAGMIVQGFFAEAVNRAPGLIIGNANYVKKVVFPLEILPIVSMGAAIFHAAISTIILAIVLAIVNQQVNWTIIFLPIIFAPITFFTLGVSWGLASLGVFMRDIGQTIGILTSVLMFLSPVFYPVSALPEKIQGLMMINPLTFIIEQVRAVTIYGQTPSWSGLAIYAAIALGVMWAGYAWFQMTRKGFADVL